MGIISEKVSWLIQLTDLGTHVASLLLLSAHEVTVTGLPTMGRSLAQRWSP